MTGPSSGDGSAASDSSGLDESTFRERSTAMGLEEDEIQAELDRAREAAASGDVTLEDALGEALNEIAVRMGHEG